MSQTDYDRLRALGLELPPNEPPIGNFLPYVPVGGLLFISGQAPTRPDGSICAGKVGDEVTADEAYDHARLTGLGLIALMQDALGDLARVRRVVKLLGMVNATPDFTAHPAVINGCSDLLVAVFGERGRHARSAIGMASLPNRISVEIEVVIEVD